MSLRNQQVIADLPFKVKPIIDITDNLMRNDKGDWEPDRTPAEITHISIHHSAVEGASIDSYARYHVGTLGWRSIGYHLVVKGDQLYQTNDLLSFTYHTSSNNGYSVSVSVSGDLSKRGMTDDERNCLYAAILTLMSLFNIPVENVLGHREYPGNNTSCPCLDMNKLRDDISKLQLQMKAVTDPVLIMARAKAGSAQHAYLCSEYAANPVKYKWLESYLLKMDEVTQDMGMYFNSK
jgi:hypothetical protein